MYPAILKYFLAYFSFKVIYCFFVDIPRPSPYFNENISCVQGNLNISYMWMLFSNWYLFYRAQATS